MIPGLLRVTDDPPGGEPEEIRRIWKGLSFQYYGESTSPLADVVTSERVERRGGFLVKWNDAMDAIGQADPMARTWWEASVKPPPKMIVIPTDCCKVEFPVDFEAEDL
ncbi:MAG: hypothetical protein JWL80_209 [Parcubacteria group bacterium]|nr:hypothetical protein [Parcubacteria group bacterium]